MEEVIKQLVTTMQQQQQQQMEQFAQILGQFTTAVKPGEPAQNKSVTVPRFDSYNRDKESWTQYLQRLNQHFTVYNVSDSEQKRACLLSWIGSECYELLTKLYGSEDITTMSFDNLAGKLSTHFTETKHVQAARYQFYNCKMKPNQSYSDWAADLRGLARNCNFTCKKEDCGESYVDDQIRDIIIKETPHADVRRQCLLDPDPTLENVLKKAATYIQTAETDKVLKGETSTPVTTNQMSSTYKRQNKGSQGKGPQFRKSENQTAMPTQSSKLKSCPQCYISHDRKQCPHRNKQCKLCNKTGHISSVCKTSSKSSGNNSHFVEESSSSVYNIYERKGKQIWINTTVNNKQTQFQWDTGATCSMVGNKGYEALGSPPYQQTDTTLHSYGNTAMQVRGECYVTVTIGQTTKNNLRLLIVDSDEGVNLLGVDWSDSFGLSQQGLSAVDSDTEVTNAVHNVDTKVKVLTTKYPDVFKPGIGHCKTFKVPIYLKSEQKPCFSKPREIPYSQHEATRAELSRLEAEGVIQRINFSNWAAPIVVVTKPSGKVRICGDFKRLNQCISIDQHPLPKLDDLMNRLRGGRFFTKLDLADAYLQLELEDDAKQLCVINTPFGLYQYNRMCFGIAPGPAQFQRCMDTLTQKLPGVAAYLDDLIITGKTEEEHWTNLTNLLSTLQEHGFRIRLDKCEFFKHSVEYLGHTIDKDGKRPTAASMAALSQLPRPQDLHQLQAFLGKVNYYGRFISNLADKAAPLYNLLKNDTAFTWSNECEQAFTQLKNSIINATSLTHYDETKPLILAADASSYGLGVVLSQDTDQGEVPVAYASKTLTDTQKNYSQIEREALSIIYGVTKFRQFLYGRHFTLVTDHEPLTTIFAPGKNIPTLTAQRLQRWALTLMGFQFTIRYRKTSQHGNADCLSRLPFGPDSNFDRIEQQDNKEISHAIQEQIFTSPVAGYNEVRQETVKDQHLQRVITWIQQGWPVIKPDDKELGTFWIHRDSLQLEQGVLLLIREQTSRVVIPRSLQCRILDTLHSSHWGVVKVKQLARRYVWWSTINTDIELAIKSCEVCQESAAAPGQKFQSWPKTDKPWERIHLDFAGPFRGKMWLICIDACSKFPYIGRMEIGQTTSRQTVQVLKDIFAIEGVPATIVTDNGPQFSSQEFTNFCNSFHINHVLSPPYHPPSNGEAERFVRTFKSSVDKNCEGGASLDESIRLTLASYRTIPHPALEWKTPAEVLHGRQPRGLLSLLQPTNHKYPKHDKPQTTQFTIDSLVYARNYSTGPKWIPGTIISKQGNAIYIVQTDSGNWKRHANQLQIRLPSTNMNKSVVPNTPQADNNIVHPHERRYPTRERRQPDWYKP